MTPALYGLSVVATVVLAAAGAAARRHEALVARIGRLPRTEELGAKRSGTIRSWIARRAIEAGWRGSPGAFVGVLASSSALGGAVGAWSMGPVGGIVAAVVSPVALVAVVRGRARRDRGRAEGQLREYVLALAAGVRAGLSVRRALAEAARDVEPPLRPALDSALRALEVGEPIDAALERLASVAGERDARLLASLLSVHVRSGGDLPALLDDVATIVGQRIESRRSVRALTAQGRASGVVLAVLPVAFVALLSWTSGDGLGAFYATPLGSGLLLAGLLCEGLGFLWIRRIVEAPARER